MFNIVLYCGQIAVSTSQCQKKTNFFVLNDQQAKLSLSTQQTNGISNPGVTTGDACGCQLGWPVSEVEAPADNRTSIFTITLQKNHVVVEPKQEPGSSSRIKLVRALLPPKILEICHTGMEGGVFNPSIFTASVLNKKWNRCNCYECCHPGS